MYDKKEFPLFTENSFYEFRANLFPWTIKNKASAKFVAWSAALSIYLHISAN